MAYYFDVALWSSQFNHGYRRVFRAMAGIPFPALAAALAALLAVLGGWFGRATRQRAAGFCTAATGFTMIGLEMLLLLGFQAVYGYVYQQLAVVIAGVHGGNGAGELAGAAPPARGGMRAARHSRRCWWPRRRWCCWASSRQWSVPTGPRRWR